MEPHSNREKERQKYYVCYSLDVIAQGGHPLTYSTMHYGQVQKRHWTQLSTREKMMNGPPP
jgi:hypothetical protein